jgi:hypothetical protein
MISYRRKHDGNSLKISGKVIKMMFALEASGGYVGWDLWQTIDEFKKLLKGFELKLTPVVGREMNDVERISIDSIEWLYASISTNVNAQSLLSGSSCGSSTSWQDMFGSELKDMVDFGKQNILQDILENKEETYSFDHEGKCVVCKVDPKKLGPCGICEQCDHKIRQQAG